jgi:GNAT superfamily N-acetyltransferase
MRIFCGLIFISIISYFSLYAEPTHLLKSDALSSEQPFTMRPAQIEDLDTLYELICDLAAYEGKDLATLPVTKENLKRYGFGQQTYFHVELAENPNGIIGYALYSYGYSGHQGRPFLYVDDLYVRPSERGQGIGSSLLKQLARYAQEAGCCRMEWLAFDWNDSAIAFYENLGGTLRKDLLLIRMEKDAYLKMAE